MARLVSPDRGCVGVDVSGTRYNGRIVETDNAQHARALADAGYFPASIGGVSRARGHVCGVCGFHGFFRDCSRCRSRAEDADLALTHEDLAEMAARGVPVEVVGPNGERWAEPGEPLPPLPASAYPADAVSLPAVEPHRCDTCGTATVYQSFSGGREWYCPTCDTTGMYGDGEAPRRVQMLADGRVDELRAEMRAARS